jgi:hypothetical protein
MSHFRLWRDSADRGRRSCSDSRDSTAVLDWPSRQDLGTVAANARTGMCLAQI